MVLKAHLFRANRRMLHGVLTLSVVVAVASAGILYYLDTHRYPSEETPLVLRSWGISWVMEQGVPYQSFLESRFDNVSLWWTEYDGSGYGTSALDSTFPRMNMLEFELPDNVTRLFETYVVIWHSDETVDGVRIIGAYGGFVTDDDGDGLFDYGDAVSLFWGVYENGTLTRHGFAEDTEYGIGLCPPQHTYSIQFKYAIHHGKLYAWASD